MFVCSGLAFCLSLDGIDNYDIATWGLRSFALYENWILLYVSLLEMYACILLGCYSPWCTEQVRIEPNVSLVSWS